MYTVPQKSVSQFFKKKSSRVITHTCEAFYAKLSFMQLLVHLSLCLPVPPMTHKEQTDRQTTEKSYPLSSLRDYLTQ